MTREEFVRVESFDGHGGYEAGWAKLALDASYRITGEPRGKLVPAALWARYCDAQALLDVLSDALDEYTPPNLDERTP